MVSKFMTSFHRDNLFSFLDHSEVIDLQPDYSISVRDRTQAKAGSVFEVAGERYQIDRRVTGNIFFARNIKTRELVRLQPREDAQAEYAAFVKAPKQENAAQYLGVGVMGESSCLVIDCIPDTYLVNYSELKPIKVKLTYVDQYTAHIEADTREQVLQWWRQRQDWTSKNQLRLERIENAATMGRIVVRDRYRIINKIFEEAGMEFDNPDAVVVNYKAHILSHPEKVYTIAGNNYQILKVISDDTYYGDVFLAIDVNTQAKVAIKILRTDLDREHCEMFKMHQRGGHPNVVKYIGHGQIYYKNCIVMEYIDGPSWAEYEQRHEWTNELQQQYEDGLKFVTDLDIDHEYHNRKANVMIGKDSDGKPQVKLIDFGTRLRDI